MSKKGIGKITLRETKLGWALGGKINDQELRRPVNPINCNNVIMLSNQTLDTNLT